METRISVWGDSITWGETDPEAGGWVARLRKFFDADEKHDISVYNLGIHGDTADNLLKRFNVECSARNRHPQIIIFAIGTNDSRYIKTLENPQTTINIFKNNLRELIGQAKNFSDQIVFVGLTKVDEGLTMPVPWSKEKFYSNDNITKYDSSIKEVCGEYDLFFVDLHDLLEDGDLSDGLHPNSNGHEKIFLKIKNFLLTNKII